MCLIVPYAENLYGFTLMTPAVRGLVCTIAPVNNPHQVKHVIVFNLAADPDAQGHSYAAKGD